MSPDKEEFNPYVGPRPFELKDHEIFFGRSQETEEIVSLIFGHPVVLVYAESGAGKTSLFNAQVIPTLEEYSFQVLPIARVQGKPPDDVKPEDIKNLYAFNVLRSVSPHSNHKDLLSESLVTFLSKYPRKLNRRQKSSLRVLIIDQFEELFNLYIKRGLEQQNTFFRQISDAVAADPMLRVVLIIREDFLAQLDPFSQYLPEGLRPRFRLVRLNRKSALSAITEPLKNTKRSYAKGVAEDLVEELLKVQVEIGSGRTDKITGEYVEPVQLQVVCERLWQKLPSEVNQITKDYVGDVDNALADFYVKAIREAVTDTHIEEARLRDWCETKLITSSGTRSIIHREVETTGGIPNRVVDILENIHLIRAEQRFGARWYELTHDRLIEPIKDSNKQWRLEFEKERERQIAKEITETNDRIRRRNKKLLIIVPTLFVVSVLFTLYALFSFGIIYTSQSPSPSLIPTNCTGISGTMTNVPAAGKPLALAVNPKTNLVYIVNDFSNSTLVIDCKTNNVVDSIPIANATTIAVNPNTNKIYIAGLFSDKLSVVDGRTKHSISNMTFSGPSSIAVNPNTNMVYVTNRYSDHISVINDTTNNIQKNITVNDGPSSIAVNPNTNMVYVTNYGFTNISIVNGSTNSIAGNVTIFKPSDSSKSFSPLDLFNDVAVNPNTNRIYVANTTNNSTSVIDGNTNRVVKNIVVGAFPSSIVVDSKRNLVYVANHYSNTISVINGTTDTVIQTFGVSGTPQSIAVNPNTNIVYVESPDYYNFGSSTVSLINPDLIRNLENLIQVGNSPLSLAVNPFNHAIYVSNSHSNTVSVINSSIKDVVDNIAVGKFPFGVAINGITNKIYVANEHSNTTSVIDGETNQVKNVTVGGFPIGIAVNPSTNKIYVANEHSNTTSVIDGETNQVKNVTVGGFPIGIAVNPSTNKIYVANEDSNTTSVIDGKNDTVKNKKIAVVSRPIAVAVNPKTNLVYVASSSAISVIDGTTDKQIRIFTIRGGVIYPSAINIDQNKNLIYVVDRLFNTILVIDGRTNSVIQRLSPGLSGPTAIDIDQRINMIYITNRNSNNISVIDGRIINSQQTALNISSTGPSPGLGRQSHH
jgi:YVTN family beta-propeller protein